MKNSPLYIVSGRTTGVAWNEPQTYSDPLPYSEALSVMQDLESQTDREDITFELIEA
jgi:hypothetical protein